MNDSHFAAKKRVDHIMTAFFRFGAWFAVLLLIAFVGYVMVEGCRCLTADMLSFTEKGLGNQLFNTLYLVFLSLVFSAVGGIPAGVYLAEYAHKGHLVKGIRMAVETLSSLPSIVVGLFGYLVFIVIPHSEWNMLAGALTVSILMLPLLTSVTEDALRTLPESYRLSSYGLGASQWQTVLHVLLPAAFPRIMTGLIMAPAVDSAKRRPLCLRPVCRRTSVGMIGICAPRPAR